jgi:hypothetical protein
LASAPDQREAAHGGESKNANFTDAHGRATMAAVFRSRRADQDDLTFPEAPCDD